MRTITSTPDRLVHSSSSADPKRDMARRQMAAIKAATRRPPKPAPTYGMCTACGSVEVALDTVDGHADLSATGESSEYPLGSGCEVCS